MQKALRHAKSLFWESIIDTCREELEAEIDVTNTELMAFELGEADKEAYNRLAAVLSPGMGRHRMLGWPDYVQNPMKLQCQIQANPDRSYGDWFELGEVTLPHYQALAAETEAAEWTLLFQMDTVSGSRHMRWGDGGRHYWWIRRADLARGDFSYVHYEMQSG